MGYFSNGTEGEIYQEEFCDRCVHGGDAGCAIWTLHMLYNYEHCNIEDSLLHVLIPRVKGDQGYKENQQCSMFIKAK